VNAVVLVAGVARRLAPLTDRTPKSLLPVGGRPILTRLLAALEAVGVREAFLVVGHCADQIRQVAGDRFGRLGIRYVDNPAYTKGSALSLYAARAHLREPVLVMDGDVVCPREFPRRLIGTPSPSAVLLDRAFRDTGEEIKVYTRGDRVVGLGKKIVPDAWEGVGENIGFFKCGAEALPELIRRLEQVVAEDSLAEWEDAVHLVLPSRHVGWVDVTGLPWTEIDFAEDLRRAESDVLPHVVRLDGA
jgi:choline kinase